MKIYILTVLFVNNVQRLVTEILGDDLIVAPVEESSGGSVNNPCVGR